MLSILFILFLSAGVRADTLSGLSEKMAAETRQLNLARETLDRLRGKGELDSSRVRALEATIKSREEIIARQRMEIERLRAAAPPVAQPGKNVTEDVKRVRSAYQSAWSDEPENLTKTSRILSRAGGVAALTGLARHALDDMARRAIEQGKCPVNAKSEDVFRALMELDPNRVDSISSDCARQGKELDYSGFLKALKDNGKNAISSAKCTEQGELQIIHKNGLVTRVHYSDENSIEAYAVFKGAPEEATERVDYKGVPDWKVETTLKVKSGATLDRTESWQSFQSRSYCSNSPCHAREMMLSFDGFDDATSARSPFGSLQTDSSQKMAETLLRVRKLLLARRGGRAHFRENCEALGARAPQEIHFTSERAEDAGTTGTKKTPPVAN